MQWQSSVAFLLSSTIWKNLEQHLHNFNKCLGRSAANATAMLEAPLTIQFAATAPLSAREPRDGQAVAGFTPPVQGPLTVAGALAVIVSHPLDASLVFC